MVDGTYHFVGQLKPYALGRRHSGRRVENSFIDIFVYKFFLRVLFQGLYEGLNRATTSSRIRSESEIMNNEYWFNILSE